MHHWAVSIKSSRDLEMCQSVPSSPWPPRALSTRFSPLDTSPFLISSLVLPSLFSPCEGLGLGEEGPRPSKGCGEGSVRIARVKPLVSLKPQLNHKLLSAWGGLFLLYSAPSPSCDTGCSPFLLFSTAVGLSGLFITHNLPPAPHHTSWTASDPCGFVLCHLPHPYCSARERLPQPLSAAE